MTKRIYYPQGKKAKKNKKRRHVEHNHQKAVFDLAKMYETKIPELALLRGSLEGVNLDIRTAKWAKDAGVKSGFPDIHWPIARGRWFSLYLELKTDEGHATPKQLKIATMLRQQNNLVEFPRGSQQAWDYLMKYYSFEPLIIRKADPVEGQIDNAPAATPDRESRIIIP